LHVRYDIVVEESEARRVSGGRIRISRPSRPRTPSRNTRIRISTNIYRPSRPWGVGKYHTRWESYASAGYIHGYLYYTRTRYYLSHRDRGLSHFSVISIV